MLNETIVRNPVRQNGLAALFPEHMAKARPVNGIAANLTKLRGDQTQEQIAELTGVPQNQISKYERGHARPDSLNLLRLAAGYKVTLDELVRGEYPVYDEAVTSDATRSSAEAEAVTLKVRLLTLTRRMQAVAAAAQSLFALASASLSAEGDDDLAAALAGAQSQETIEQPQAASQGVPRPGTATALGRPATPLVGVSKHAPTSGAHTKAAVKPHRSSGPRKSGR